MEYDFVPDPSKFDYQPSEGVIRFKEEFLAAAAEQGISPDQLVILAEDRDKLDELRDKTWDRLTAQGHEPDGLEAAEAILELIEPVG